MSAAASIPSRSRPRRLWWVLAGIAACVLALLAFVALAGPGWLQGQLARQLGAALHREVSIGRLELHPLSLSAVVQDVSVKNGQGGELAGFERLTVDVSPQSWSQRALVLERLHLQGLRLAVVHLGQGRYDISDLLDEWSRGGPASAVPPFVLHHVELAGGRLVFDDRPHGRVHTVADLHFVLPSLSSLPAQRDTAVHPVLTATVDGAPLRLQARAVPFAEVRQAALSLSLSGFDLALLRPYLPTAWPAQPVRGRLGAQLELALQLPAEKTPVVSVTGQAQLSDLRFDDAQGQAMFGLKSLALDIERGDVSGRDIALRQIVLDAPDVRLGVGPDGHFRLGSAAQTAKAAAPPREAADAHALADGASPSPWTWRIARVAVRDGVLNFADESIQPAFRARVTGLAGEVTGLSTASGTEAVLALRGRYAQNAPIVIQARLNPLAVKKFLDLRAKVSNVELTRFSGYAGKYAGYTIEKGKFSLDASYRLHDGRLEAENHVFIDQLTFGDRVESPDATSLPVTLAVALLKNSRGEIDLDLPVTGSLDDPQFSIRGLLGKVIVNLLTKVVSAPLNLLSSLFGGGEDLSAMPFAPGLAEIDEAGRKRLAALAHAMRERRALTLEVRGLFDAARDLPALQQTQRAGAVVNDASLETLARRRAQAATRWLIEQGGVSPERIFELASRMRADTLPVGTGIEFSLR